MKLRVLVVSMAVMCTCASVAQAAAFLYRDASSGRWVGIFAKGDTRGGGVFAGSKFNDPDPFGRAPVASDACGGGQKVAVFMAKMQILAPAPNTGIFIYDANTDSITDVAVEGGPAPGGTWDDFAMTNPVVAIEPGTCTAHVFFRGKILGGPPAASDTGIFDVPVALPGFAVGAPVVVAQEGVTAVPAPFIASTFDDFPKGIHLAAMSDPFIGPPTVVLAFPAKAKGGAATPASDTGIFMMFLGGILSTAAAENSGGGCAASFGNFTYANFSVMSQRVAVGDYGFGAGPYAAYRAQTTGPTLTTDTAIEVAHPLFGCGTVGLAIPWAIEGGAGPAGVGGTYSDFPAATPLGGGSAAFFFAPVGFLAKFSGGAYSKVVVQADVGFGVVAVARAGATTDSSLGEGALSLPTDPGPATNSAGAMVFGAGVKAFPSAVFLLNLGAGPVPGQPLTFAGKYPQIDSGGNVSAKFP